VSVCVPGGDGSCDSERRRVGGGQQHTWPRSHLNHCGDGSTPKNPNAPSGMCVCVCVCVRVCAYVCECVRVCVCSRDRPSLPFALASAATSRAHIGHVCQRQLADARPAQTHHRYSTRENRLPLVSVERAAAARAQSGGARAHTQTRTYKTTPTRLRRRAGADANADAGDGSGAAVVSHILRPIQNAHHPTTVAAIKRIATRCARESLLRPRPPARPTSTHSLLSGNRVERRRGSTRLAAARPARAYWRIGAPPPRRARALVRPSAPQHTRAARAEPPSGRPSSGRHTHSHTIAA
jgi:hypothetical protein